MESLANYYYYNLNSNNKTLFKSEIASFMNSDIKSESSAIITLQKSQILDTSCTYGVQAILDYIAYKSPEFFDNQNFCENLFTILIRDKVCYTTINKSLNNYIKKYFFLNSPNTIQVKLDDDFDISVDFDVVSSTWAYSMIENYKNQLSQHQYSSYVINSYFKLLYNLSTFDFRKGIDNYGIYILYFGINNIGELLMNNHLKKQILNIDKSGTVYNDLLYVLGKEDMDYIETVCRMV